MSDQLDSRIHTSLSHLRSLEPAARKLSFLPRQPAKSPLSGRHASRLRGRGLNFEELRDYMPGDDIRTIDWKVTARTGSPHVRVFTEERDRPSYLLVDQRMSMFVGSTLNMKSVTAAEAAAITAMRILDQGDRVGGIIFDDNEVVEISARRSRCSLDRFLTTLAEKNLALSADVRKVAQPLHLNRPLESLAKIVTHNHLVIIISDFDQVDDRTEQLLGAISEHNDLILCLVTDPFGHSLPDNLKMTVSDGELQFQIDYEDKQAFQAIACSLQERIKNVLAWQKTLDLTVLPLSAGEETVPQLVRLLQEGIPEGGVSSPGGDA
jgi:uncharacterized protein (DUF58 family)